MSEDRYPILVERLRDPLLIACNTCGAEETITADDILNDGYYNCPEDCGGSATYKYIEADHKCPNCGKLGFFVEENEHCCSRRCMLQHEWAVTLEKARAMGQAL